MPEPKQEENEKGVIEGGCGLGLSSEQENEKDMLSSLNFEAGGRFARTKNGGI